MIDPAERRIAVGDRNGVTAATGDARAWKPLTGIRKKSAEGEICTKFIKRR